MKLIGGLFLIALFSCAASKSNDMKLHLTEIKEVYFQKWIAGIEGGGSGINFHVILEKPLDNDIALVSVQFRSQKAFFVKTSETEFVAKMQSGQEDLIMDENPEKEYGNQSALMNLKQNEAVLKFQKNGETFTKKIENVKEKQIIAFPSRNKEKN